MDSLISVPRAAARAATSIPAPAEGPKESRFTWIKETLGQYKYPLAGLIAGVAMTLFLDSQIPADVKCMVPLFTGNLIFLPSLLGMYGTYLKNKGKTDDQLKHILGPLFLAALLTQVAVLANPSPMLSFGLTAGITLLITKFVKELSKSENGKTKHAVKIAYVAGLLLSAEFAYFHGGLEGLKLGGIIAVEWSAALGTYLLAKDLKKSELEKSKKTALKIMLLTLTSLVNIDILHFTSGINALAPLMLGSASILLAIHEAMKDKKGKNPMQGALLGFSAFLLLTEFAYFSNLYLGLDQANSALLYTIACLTFFTSCVHQTCKEKERLNAIS